MDPGWARVLAPVEPNIAAMWRFLRADGQYLPAEHNVLRAFDYPFDEVKVLIVGQDPYPKPGHPIGLSFAVERQVRPLPGSLQNIYAELRDDLGLPIASHGDLTPWAEQGVMLLNRVLTVHAGVRNSHEGAGWEAVTDAAIAALVARDKPLVAILWGNSAQTLLPQLGGTAVITSAHPSHMSARKGFFGSRPFSRANALLAEQGASPVDWSLE